MKSIYVAMAAFAVMSFASASAAEPLVAKLQAPVAKAVESVSEEAVFSCEGDTCTATFAESGAWTVAGCRALARNVGAITSYGATDKELSAEKLAQCNKAAKTPS